MIVFVYEDICANAGSGDTKSPLPASLLREGRAMLDAVTEDFRCMPSVQVQNVVSPNAFAHQASLADYTLVIAPETGGRLEFLASEVVRLGGKLLGPSPEAIRLTGDKLALARHWEAHGVSTPKTWVLGEQPSGGPMVVKPRDGAGSQDMRLATVRARSVSEGEIPALAYASGSIDVMKIVAQHYVSGFAASVAFLIGPTTTIPLVPCAQRLSTDGQFQYEGGYLPIAPDLADRAIRIATSAIASVPGLLGYIGVDVILGDDGRDWAIEINPRLTTSYVGLRALAKFNIAEALLAIIQDDSLPKLDWGADPIQFTPDGQVSPLAASRALVPTPS